MQKLRKGESGGKSAMSDLELDLKGACRGGGLFQCWKGVISQLVNWVPFIHKNQKNFDMFVGFFLRWKNKQLTEILRTYLNEQKGCFDWGETNVADIAYKTLFFFTIIWVGDASLSLSLSRLLHLFL